MFVAVASLSPVSALPDVGLSDKFEHGITYAILTLWFCGAYRNRSRYAIGVGVFALGASLEGLQALTATRSAELADLFANTAGILAALVLATAGLGNWCAKVESLAGADR